MVTLRDIAERTGLSVNTVSLALRESPRISAETRKRVRQAAQALDYLPNHAAKALVNRRSMTVGLLLTDITSPVLTQVARSVEFSLKAQGYVTLLAASNDDPEEEGRALATFRARQVDGVLVYPNNCNALDHVVQLHRTGMPVVLLAGPDDPPLDVVCVDERSGADRAVRHLIEAGHRRIGMIDSTRQTGNRQKQQGYAAALAAAGLAADPALVVDPRGHGPACGFDAFARLMALRPRPTAVLAANDPLALGGLRWCQRNGVAVPGDLAVVGFDNVDFGAFASTPLTTVDYAVDEVARTAVARLLTLIDGSAEAAHRAIRIEPRLIVRDSTAGAGAT